MALFNIFKKKIPEKKEKPKGRKEEKIIEKPKEIKEEIKVAPRKEKKNTGESFRFLNSVHITEKATDLTKDNQYVFNVSSRANKREVKKSIEEVYGVEVERVNMIHSPAKKRRLGRREGFREGLENGYKKAIVKLKEGYKIEILPR